jgi:hypothetical protein
MHNAVHRGLADGSWETVLHDDRLLWPDTMSVAADGHLYVTANNLYRQAQYQGGQDRRHKPYLLVRTPIDAGPCDCADDEGPRARMLGALRVAWIRRRGARSRSRARR